MPRSGRGAWATVVLLVAILGAIFAATLGGALLFVLAVAAVGYAIYAVAYRGDRLLRKKTFFGGEN